MVHESSSETLSKRIRILKKLQQKNIYTKKQCKIITDTETKEIGSSISHSFKQYDDYYKESISGMCDKYTSGNQKSKETIDAELQALKNTEAQLGNNIRTSQANILKMKEECELRKDENYHLQKEMDFKEEQARRALAVINEIEQIRAEMRGLCQKVHAIQI
uniref:Coiled-coil domain-containing protein 153 n=1 Tax=Rhabditophanes sp. KR3021 TaxID=114890 RepID=A0AC35TM08_9BILA